MCSSKQSKCGLSTGTTTPSRSSGRKPPTTSSPRSAANGPHSPKPNPRRTTSFAVFGRWATNSAFHCATDARYSSFPHRVAGVAPKLPRDRRRRPADPTSGRPDTHTLRAQDRYLLALMKRQVAALQRSEIHRWHSATMPEPSTSNCLRHADRSGGLLARHSSCDHTPELLLDLSAKRRRTRRPHRRTPRQLLHPPCWPAHQQPPHRSVATTS